MPKSYYKEIALLQLSILSLFGTPTSLASDWPQYGNLGGQQYTPLTQINATNVNELQELWRLRTGDLGQGFARKGHSMQANPHPCPTGGRCLSALVHACRLLAAKSRAIWDNCSGAALIIRALIANAIAIACKTSPLLLGPSTDNSVSI